MDQLGSDMLVDPTDYDEKQDVAIISPDDAMEDTDGEPEPRADEFDAIMKRLLPELPDQETEAEAIDTWEIRDWRSLPRREHGPVFKCGEHPWRVLFFPQGNNVEFVSFYLEHGFEDKPPEDWYACVQFMLVLWNPNDPSIYVSHSATHRFTAEEGDWGFTRFAELRKIFASQYEDKGRPMVENESAKVTAYVRVLKDPTGVLWHNFINYDSKKETGMVGLKNQGATCYLNSLLQSLYFTPAFRKAIYQIPTETDVAATSSAYALQQLFYMLQTNVAAVPTNSLTHSFGWDSKQIFEQQDVQELSRILMEKMEEKMKGTAADNALPQMFVGKMKTYISCINVDYESSRLEDFWDIQLNVSGNKNLDDSFKDYVQVETMDGENKYFAEGFGLQDAKKGVIFESFPQVLHLQLKRFEYDIHRDAMMKVNDRYEFPEFWDASPYLSETADRSEPYMYQLHGVLVHSGDLNAGHYYAFLKPGKDTPFYKFDDDRVTRATKKEALEENFGGDYTNLPNGNAQQRNPYTRTWSTKRSMSAYMLVYIRQSRLDSIFLKDDDVEPPPHLAQKIAEDRAIMEKKRKEREEAHLYMEVQVATEENFKAHQGFDIVPWKGDSDTPAYPKSYRILRATPVSSFTAQVAEELGCEPEMLRPWAMVNRQNGTIRPDCVIEFPAMSVEDAANKYGTKIHSFRLWMERAIGKDEDGKPIWGDAKVDLKAVPNNRAIMLFLKHFDPEAQTLVGAATFYAAWHDKVQDISAQILEVMDWPSGTSFKLTEEIKQNMIEPMKPKMSLQASEIQDGDIITVQRTLPEKDASTLAASGKYTEVREFYDYLLHRISVTFAAKVPKEDEEQFTLVLSKKMTYDQFSAKVGEHLNVDPTHIRFSTVNATTGRPKMIVKRGPQVTLANVLTPSYASYGAVQNQRPDQLYYEVLELSLSELETRKNIKITWLPEGLLKEELVEVLVTKNGTIADVLAGLQKKANLSDEEIENIRVYEVHSGKVYKVLPKEYSVASLHEFFTLYAERIPDEEKEAPEDAHFINTFHYDKEPNKTHNVPFELLLKDGEPFKETKERISKRTGIKGKNFEKIKFALVTRSAFSRPQSLEDDDIITEKIANSTDDIYLGLDHVNKTRNTWAKSDSMFIR